MDKKAISPVVATALLLVVAVVAVVGFQIWFNTYQSGLETRVEAQSDGTLIIERLEFTDSGAAANVYVRNPNDNTTTINEIRILKEGTLQCNNDSSEGMPQTVSANSVSNFTTHDTCGLTRTESYDVVLVTDSGVFSQSEIAR